MPDDRGARPFVTDAVIEASLAFNHGPDWRLWGSDGVNGRRMARRREILEHAIALMLIPTESDEIRRLKAVIERQRTYAARWLDRIKAEIERWTEMAIGRGPYEWDDDRYRAEFGKALRAIRSASERAARDLKTLDFTDCPGTYGEVVAALSASRLMDTLRQRVARALALQDFKERHEATEHAPHGGDGNFAASVEELWPEWLDSADVAIAAMRAPIVENGLDQTAPVICCTVCGEIPERVTDLCKSCMCYQPMTARR